MRKGMEWFGMNNRAWVWNRTMQGGMEGNTIITNWMKLLKTPAFFIISFRNMNTSCEFISEPPMVEKTEEKKSKNEERKNETILPPIQRTGTTPKTPRIHRVNQ